MARRGTFDSKRADARALYDQGHSCRSIADRLGVAPSTISRWAKDEGLAFDRSQTDLATRAHTIDMAKDRLELAQMMVVAARDGLLELDGPITVYSFGGRDNEFNSHTFDRAPADVRRQALTTAGIAFDKASKVLDGSSESAEVAESLLDRLEAEFTEEFSDVDDAEFGVVP